MKIGFFDSGLGGLLVLKATVKTLPQYDYLYYADTANLPYGDKSEEEIYTLTKAALDELFARDCLLVIVACNTASAETLRRLQDSYLKEAYPDRRVLGVIVPTIEEVVEREPKSAVLIATTRTVQSGKYERELAKVNDDIEFKAVATPELVPLVESHQMDDAVDYAVEVLEREARAGDVVLLGCTHYILLKDALRAHFASRLTFIAQDEVVPKKLAHYLEQHPEITSRLSTVGERTIVLTEHRPDYDRLTAEFLEGAYLAESD